MSQQLDDLKINETYTDRYGKSWIVLAFLRDTGKRFEDDPDGTHVHVMRADPTKRPSLRAICKA
jgi:hypothetical protein